VENKIKNILNVFKFAYKKKLEEEEAKAGGGGEGKGAQTDQGRSVKEDFQSKLAAGDVSAQDVIDALAKLTRNQVDPEVVKMLNTKPMWSERSLYKLWDNLASSIESTSRFHGKFKAFNHNIRTTTDEGFVHAQVPNPDGFSIYLQWKDLPDKLKPLEEKMKNSQADKHGGGLKDLIGYMGVTPWDEITKGEGGEKKIAKRMWVLQEIQAPMFDPKNWKGKLTPEEFDLINQYMGDWYKALWNQAIKLGQRFGVDELWGATPEAVATTWPGGGVGKDSYGGAKYKWMKAERDKAVNKLNDPQAMKKIDADTTHFAVQVGDESYKIKAGDKQEAIVKARKEWKGKIVTRVKL
jgi:hypothetical protein